MPDSQFWNLSQTPIQLNTERRSYTAFRLRTCPCACLPFLHRPISEFLYYSIYCLHVFRIHMFLDLVVIREILDGGVEAGLVVSDSRRECQYGLFPRRLISVVNSHFDECG